MQTLQQWADYLVVGIYHSPREVGLYAAAKTLYRLFDAVREGAVLLIVPVTSRLYSSGDKEKLSNLVEKLLFIAFGVLVPIAVVLAVGSDQLMSLFYKDKFPGIGEVFRILILTGTILPLMLVSTNVLIGMGHAKGLFYSVLGGTIIFFVLNRVLVPDMASSGAAISVLVSTAAIGIFSYISMRRQIEISMRGVIGNIQHVRATIATMVRRDNAP
jgi:O-antigen/teichoic acid export membrane protein